MSNDARSGSDQQSPPVEILDRAAGNAGSTRSQFLKRAALTGAGAMGASAVLAACGGGGASSGVAASGGPTLAAGATPKLKAAFKNKTVGVPIYTTVEEQMVVLLEFIEEAAEVGGLNWTFISDDTKASQAAAESAVQSYIDRGVDLIIDDVVPAAFLEAQFAEAKKKGIPVIGAYTLATADSSITGDYSNLLAQEASLLAQFMVSDLEESAGGKKVKVAMIDAALEVLEPRRWAFESVVEHAPNFEIVEQDFNVDITNLVPDGTRRAEGLLRKNSDLSAIWVGIPSLALPVASAVAQGGANVPVFGHSPGAAGVEAVQAQNTPLKAITWGDLRYNAYGLVDMALQALAGEEISRRTSILDPIPSVVFGPENVNEEVPKGTSAKDWSFAGGTYVTYFTNRWQQKYGA